MKSDGSFTFFASKDDAFNRLPANLIHDLQQVENKDVSQKVLVYHISTTLVTYPSLTRRPLPFNLTMAGDGVTKMNKQGAKVKVNDASVTENLIFSVRID